MANLTASYDALDKDGRLQNYPIKAATKIYKGALVAILGSTGLLEPCGDTANQYFAGVAYEDGDNSAGAAGAVSARVTKMGSFVYNCTGAAQTWVGRNAMALDDNTVALTSTNSVQVGVITEFISSTRVRVRINVSAK